MQGQLSGAAPAQPLHYSAAQGIITSHGFACVHIRSETCPKWGLSAVLFISMNREEMGTLSISVHIRGLISQPLTVGTAQDTRAWPWFAASAVGH